MISKFKRMCRNNSKLNVLCLNSFSFPVNNISKHEKKKKHKTLNIEF